MKRIDIETALNESRNKMLHHYLELSDEELRRPLTPSEHDSDNMWHALDHLVHLSLIESNFQRMIRKQLAGEPNPVGLLNDDGGKKRSREEIAAMVHEWTDNFQREHHDDSFEQAVIVTAKARAATLELLNELSDEQLAEPLHGAPWGDGTIGGVLAANATHAEMHWVWTSEARSNDNR